MNDEITVLDLFSGIGGFSYALEQLCPARAFRTIAFCEQDKFCQAVLRKHWPDVPIYDDVRTIPTDGLGRVDIVVGGFPCQPWSQAGQQRGAEDERDLWSAMAAIIEKLQPKWVIGENVRGFVNQRMGLERSLSDLARIGYQAVPFIIGACSVDAPHRRSRVWIVAAKNDTDTDSERSHRKNVNEQREDEPADGEERVVGQVCSVLAGSGDASERRPASVAHSDSHGEPNGIVDEEPRSGELVGDTRHKGIISWDANGTNETAQFKIRAENTKPSRICTKSPNGDAARLQGREQRRAFEPGMGGMVDGVPRWLDEPDCGRVASGVKNRARRLKSLGNAVVPQVVAQIGKAILAAEDAG